MNIRSRLITGACIIFWASVVTAEHQTPMQRVQHTVDQVITLLNDNTLGRETRWQRIAPVIRESFNFPGISQSVLATHWDKVPEEQRAEFVEYFSRYLELIYREKMETYSNEKISYGSVIDYDGFAFVETFITTETTKIPLNFKLKKHSDGWYAYDVEIEGISLVANYRHSFAQIIHTQGLDGLFAHLERHRARHR